ncbi:MAG: trk/ktr system potassium uptake protein [Miltoncostaeaceae bacterium]|nr:trk/ktr system potassium uptake protein [Miltoncostaeaceae bacterium]
MGKRESILIIGLGRFGRAMAEELVSMGHEVLGVDTDVKIVQDAMDRLTHVVQADATDVEALRQIGAADFATAVVAIGNDVQASILATYALVDVGVKRIWAKAITAAHGAILQRVGAHRVVFPERDMGVRVAHTLGGRTLDYLELDANFALIETTVPRGMAGKTLEEAGVRKRHGVSVVCVKRPGGTFDYATPDTVINEDDVLVVAGECRKAEAFAALE